MQHKTMLYLSILRSREFSTEIVSYLMQAKTYFEYYNFYILNFILHVVGFIISIIILQKSYFASY